MANYSDYEIVEDLPDEFKADESSDFTPAPAGTHIARCIKIIALGTQEGEYLGVKQKPRKKLMFVWELPEAMHEFTPGKGEEPHIVSKIYSLVTGEKATWTQHVEAWTGSKPTTSFNPMSLLGKPCQITVGHTTPENGGKPKAKVTGLMGMTKNQTCPDKINPLRVLSFSKWDEDLFNEQGPKVKEMIEKSPEYKAMKRKAPLVEGNNEGKFVKEPLADDLSNL